VTSAIALGFYALATLLLAVYALHSLWLLGRFIRHRRGAAEEAARELATPLPASLPHVLVQLPVFNERDVVARLVAAAGRLRWPRDRLRIQLLDDSSDDSVAIGRTAIERLRARGLDAIFIQRTDRVGYKAGALTAGLDADAADTRGPAEYVAIFDADFVPPADFLERAIKPLLADPGLALVQGRWEHLNRDASVLTRAQALGIDAHFAIEQGARAWSGLPMNFNGTCGLWRRDAIRDGGGWQHDTLTEDIDLSYRVQLAGWRCTYRLDLAVPGEIPETVSAWRAQQFRWAKGSIQTSLKLLGRVWRCPWPLSHKVAATLHMTHYLVHPLILVSLIAAPIAMPALHGLSPTALFAGLLMFVLGVGAPIITYLAAQRVLRGRGAWSRVRELPMLAAIGTGVAISNTQAVWQAVRGHASEFVRTPKQGDRQAGSYRASRARGVAELGGAGWAAFGALRGAEGERPWMGLLLVMYCCGFAWVGVRLYRESRVRAPRPVNPHTLRWLAPIGVASLIGYGLLALQPGSWRAAPVLFAALGGGLGALYLAAVWRVRRDGGAGLRASTVAWVVAVALGMRLLSLGLAPSDDVNRYLVEGTQVLAGENPYDVTPERSTVLGTLAPSVVAGVNHLDWTAIYPPVTLAFESAVTALSATPFAFKIAALLAELVGLWAVWRLIRRGSLSPAWLLVAAWNPVGPLFAAGEGHHDFLMAALIALSLLAAGAGRRSLGLVAAALAALTKPFALVAIPAQASLGRARTRLIPGAVALLAYLPFAAAGPGMFRSLGRFGGEMHFHGALEPAVRWVAGALAPASLVQPLTVGALGAIWVAASVYLWRRGQADGTAPATLTARLLAVLLLCVPTLHPWYFAPLVLLLPFTRSWALLLWTALAPIYWLHGLAMPGGAWAELPWVTALAHLPAVALLAWEAHSSRTKATSRPRSGRAVEELPLEASTE